MNSITDMAGPTAFTCHYCKKEVKTIYVCWYCETRMCYRDFNAIQICLKPHEDQTHMDHDTCRILIQ
jgi:hypothetical protein